MKHTRLSSKGQMVLPASLRNAHGWKAGQEFIIEEVGDGVLLRPRGPFRPTRLEDVAGCLAGARSRRTIEDMEAAIATAAKERWRARG